MKRKIAMMITILMLAIGFAIVSTTLVINGNINVGNSDFEVIFTDAILDGINIYDTSALSEDKKTITFTSKDLKILVIHLNSNMKLLIRVKIRSID